ncbi:MAG TPA: hypothetical protein VG406_09385 [Isosphaeraceae bacterium]|jgi:hypothetical protein|nr:hypothetical protein [Isosphaeraceae bacterium]
MDGRRTRRIRLGDLMLLLVFVTSCLALARAIVIGDVVQRRNDKVAIDFMIGMGSLLISFGLVSARIAQRRGRNPLRWFLLGFLFTWMAVYLVYRLPAIPGDRRRPPSPAPREEPAGPSTPESECDRDLAGA